MVESSANSLFVSMFVRLCFIHVLEILILMLVLVNTINSFILGVFLDKDECWQNYLCYKF